MKRREFISISITMATILLTGCGNSSKRVEKANSSQNNSNDSNNNNSNNTIRPTNTTLPIPKLLKGEIKNGVKHYDLTIQKSKHYFFENIQTDTYAINSSYLGPTLLLKNGDEISINYTNNLSETTTIHGHGMHVPANMDGGPHQKIKSNKSWSARYRVNQKASTNWYHPHLMGKTAEHVYKGLSGMIIVEDDESIALDLPNRYGVDDIPLILQDKRFDNNKQIDYSPSRMEIMHGYRGNTYITNGAIEPNISLEAKEIRFRILNGSNSSVYELVFSDKREFYQIATDNSFLEKPVLLKELRLSPAERAEIIVDLTNDKGKSIYLKDKRENKTFLKLNIDQDSSEKNMIPSSLTTLDILDPAKTLNTREFILSGRMGELMINQKTMDINRIDEIVPIDQIEIWEVKNQMGMEHNFHIHATHFMIIERNGSNANVAENEIGYKDTVYLAPNDSVKLIVKMSDYKDPNSPYMYHCHFLEHEDAGMMGQFVVV